MLFENVINAWNASSAPLVVICDLVGVSKRSQMTVIYLAIGHQQLPLHFLSPHLRHICWGCESIGALTTSLTVAWPAEAACLALSSGRGDIVILKINHIFQGFVQVTNMNPYWNMDGVAE